MKLLHCKPFTLHYSSSFYQDQIVQQNSEKEEESEQVFGERMGKSSEAAQLQPAWWPESREIATWWVMMSQWMFLNVYEGMSNCLWMSYDQVRGKLQHGKFEYPWMSVFEWMLLHEYLWMNFHEWMTVNEWPGSREIAMWQVNVCEWMFMNGSAGNFNVQSFDVFECHRMRGR